MLMLLGIEAHGSLLGWMIGRTLIVPPDAWEVQEGACISIKSVAPFAPFVRCSEHGSLNASRAGNG